jgi:hypothetical protein
VYVNAGRFSDTPIYRICVCDSCERQEKVGAEGDPCSWEDCKGRLVEIEVVPHSAARQWRLERVLAEEKVEKLHAQLVGTFRGRG